MPLDNQQRRVELAQLAGGQSSSKPDANLDAVAYAFADSLLTQAANLRQVRSSDAKAPDAKAPDAKAPAAEPKAKAAKTRSRKG